MEIFGRIILEIVLGAIGRMGFSYILIAGGVLLLLLPFMFLFYRGLRKRLVNSSVAK